MTKEQSFAKLFRRSKFANFDSTIPRLYAASPLSSPSSSLSTERPAFFGFKRDLHPTHYERPLRYVQMRTLDGKYGQCQLRNGQDISRVYKVMSELERLTGSTGLHISDFSERQALFNKQQQGIEERIKIPGRVLNVLTGGGYAIGVGGIVAELPQAEIPPLLHFAQSDIDGKRTFYFYIKKVSFDLTTGRPQVILSLVKNK